MTAHRAALTPTQGRKYNPTTPDAHGWITTLSCFASCFSNVVWKGEHILDWLVTESVSFSRGSWQVFAAGDDWCLFQMSNLRAICNVNFDPRTQWPTLANNFTESLMSGQADGESFSGYYTRSINQGSCWIPTENLCNKQITRDSWVMWLPPEMPSYHNP